MTINQAIIEAKEADRELVDLWSLKGAAQAEADRLCERYQAATAKWVKARDNITDAIRESNGQTTQRD